MTDIKQIIENRMSEMGISRAKVCEELGWHPQGWSRKVDDAKWSTVVDVCRALGITPADLFTAKEPKPSGTVVCPYCGQGFMVAAVKTEEA